MSDFSDVVEHEQEDDCAFYRVEHEQGYFSREPIDDRALYGYLSHSNYSDDSDATPPIRNALRDRSTAIREVRAGDRVRVNDRGWMAVVAKDDEGFVAHFEGHEKEYVVWPLYTPRRSGIDSGPRMFTRAGFGSLGKVHVIEVDWNPAKHWHPFRQG